MPLTKGWKVKISSALRLARKDEKYLGFVFGRSAIITLDDSALLIERKVAADYKERTKPAPASDGTGEQPGASTPTSVGGTGATPGNQTPGEPGTPATTSAGKKQFYGTIR